MNTVSKLVSVKFFSTIERDLTKRNELEQGKDLNNNNIQVAVMLFESLQQIVYPMNF